MGKRIKEKILRTPQIQSSGVLNSKHFFYLRRTKIISMKNWKIPASITLMRKYSSVTQLNSVFHGPYLIPHNFRYWYMNFEYSYLKVLCHHQKVTFRASNFSGFSPPEVWVASGSSSLSGLESLNGWSWCYLSYRCYRQLQNTSATKGFSA